MPEERNENAFGHTAGAGMLLIPLPELDPPLAPWLAETASDGIGAHLTVLAPFLSAAELTADVLAELRRILGAFAAFDLAYARTARFPEVLYLVPSLPLPLPLPLPLRARAAAADLVVFDGSRWHLRERLPLAER